MAPLALVVHILTAHYILREHSGPKELNYYNSELNWLNKWFNESLTIFSSPSIGVMTQPAERETEKSPLMHRLTACLEQANPNPALLDSHITMPLIQPGLKILYFQCLHVFILDWANECSWNAEFRNSCSCVKPCSSPECALQWFGKFHAVFLLNWQQLWEPSGNSDRVYWMWGVSHTPPTPLPRFHGSHHLSRT